MSETFAALIAHKHWAYVWPCYVLTAAAFGALAARAVLQLSRWRKAAGSDQDGGL
jgi:hypothetical protein